jgi:hypothetical protein
MMTRNGNRVCRKIMACTERVMNPPPPRWAYTLNDIQKLKREAAETQSYRQWFVLGDRT